MADEQRTEPESTAELHVLRARVRELEALCNVLAEGSGQPSLKMLLEHSPDIVTLMDRGHRMLYLNRTIAPERVGDVLQRSALDYMPAEQREPFAQAFERAFISGEVQRLEVDSARGYVWETRLVPVKRGGEVVAIMGIGADITARRRLEEQMRQTHKLEALGRVTAGIAHNFNNMLTVILTNLSLLRIGAPEPVAARLSEVEHAAQRAADMLRELMVFARHRRHERTRETTDLAQVAARAVAMCRSSLDPRIALSLEPATGLPRVPADAGSVEQALLNVLWNARDALCDRVDPAPRIRVLLEHAELPGETPAEQRPAVRIRVIDNGPGMSEVMLGRVFEPFFTTKRSEHGTGLGLATAYGTMIDHGGTITCESRPGAGASFSLLFPITDTA
jgi:PAS domain S-box-containing protein